jgi:hypothetical protein
MRRCQPYPLWAYIHLYVDVRRAKMRRELRHTATPAGSPGLYAIKIST